MWVVSCQEVCMKHAFLDSPFLHHSHHLGWPLKGHKEVYPPFLFCMCFSCSPTLFHFPFLFLMWSCTLVKSLYTLFTFLAKEQYNRIALENIMLLLTKHTLISFKFSVGDVIPPLKECPLLLQSALSSYKVHPSFPFCEALLLKNNFTLQSICISPPYKAHPTFFPVSHVPPTILAYLA